MFCIYRDILTEAVIDAVPTFSIADGTHTSASGTDFTITFIPSTGDEVVTITYGDVS